MNSDQFLWQINHRVALPFPTSDKELELRARVLLDRANHKGWREEDQNPAEVSAVKARYWPDGVYIPCRRDYIDGVKVA